MSYKDCRKNICIRLKYDLSLQCNVESGTRQSKHNFMNILPNPSLGIL